MCLNCSRSRWCACSTAWSNTVLLERRHDPRDRRANRLFLTASGRQLVDDLDSLRDSIATDVLQDVPPRRSQTSLETLRDIKDRIKSLAEPPGHIAAK